MNMMIVYSMKPGNTSSVALPENCNIQCIRSIAMSHIFCIKFQMVDTMFAGKRLAVKRIDVSERFTFSSYSGMTQLQIDS